MQRRKFIAGVGSLAAGAAAVTGTGAFTSVRASRSVAVSTAGDRNALLRFTKATEGSDSTASDSNSVSENAEEYVTLNSGGTVSFDFTGADLGENGGGNGLNQNSTVIFDDLIDITNQGTQEVAVGIANRPSYLGVYAENSSNGSGGNGSSGGAGDNTGLLGQGDGGNNDINAVGGNGLPFSQVSENMKVAPGESITNVGIYFPDTSNIPSNTSGDTITFLATDGNHDSS
jgi:hypothetical protein